MCLPKASSALHAQIMLQQAPACRAAEHLFQRTDKLQAGGLLCIVILVHVARLAGCNQVCINSMPLHLFYAMPLSNAARCRSQSG